MIMIIILSGEHHTLSVFHKKQFKEIKQAKRGTVFQTSSTVFLHFSRTYCH